ncbi:hypothetical protein K435DRAFT_681960 [Dendrothele bispora CBS 962.96]|uniref:Uncharacterized protein n=1 Tax=Dendrothele bispora (strain CBS 962.96) TaxID=1314807 RepID=A0A4S8LEK6_DENBC|nr:hypothetical protein K435DRAFT_681960 [Dendrothele bispora CBS 962.96]
MLTKFPEHEAAEKRQKAKVDQKKAQAELHRKKAEEAARTQRQRTQSRRSAVFKAARGGNTEKVRKGIWEDNVDATGGEVNPGCDEFVTTLPKDNQETLLHIAARNGDHKLVEWLDAHNADVEEKDANGFTAFHVALQFGRIEVLNYFFENHPLKEEESAAIYACPESGSLLMLSLQSHEPEVVWMILDKKLASSVEIREAWSWITSENGKKAMKTYSNRASGKVAEKLNDIVQLLISFGGFTPPPTQSDDQARQKPSKPLSGAEKDNEAASSTQSQINSPDGPPISPPQGRRAHRGKGRSRGQGRGRGRGRGRGNP